MTIYDLLSLAARQTDWTCLTLGYVTLFWCNIINTETPRSKITNQPVRKQHKKIVKNVKRKLVGD
jgi:hypothetical protein